MVKLPHEDLLYVLLEYLPDKNRKERRIWKKISSHKPKLGSWHGGAVLELYKENGYLEKSEHGYTTTKEGREQILPLWNGRELEWYHQQHGAFVTAVLRLCRFLLRLVRRLLQV